MPQGQLFLGHDSASNENFTFPLKMESAPDEKKTGHASVFIRNLSSQLFSLKALVSWQMHNTKVEEYSMIQSNIVRSFISSSLRMLEL